MSTLDGISKDLNNGIKSKEKLGDEYFKEYFSDLLKGYQDINKVTVDGIITHQILPEARDKVYEYLYSYGALLNLYNELKGDLIELSREGEAKEIMLGLRDSKIDGITTTYGKNLQIIIRELRKHKNKIVELEKANEDRVNDGEIQINYFDISELDQGELEKKYIDGINIVKGDIDKFVSESFFGGLIDKLNIISRLKNNNTGSINDSNTINEIGENFFELITVFGELRDFYLKNESQHKEFNDIKVSLVKITEERDKLLAQKNTPKLTKVSREVVIPKSSDTKGTVSKKDYDGLKFEYDKIDLDNESLDRENRELKAHVAELCTVLGMRPSKIEGIIDFIKNERQFKKTVYEGSEMIGKAMGVISEDKSYLAKQVTIEKEKNKKHIREKDLLKRTIERKEQEKLSDQQKIEDMQRQIDEMQQLIRKNNIKKIKKGYNPVNISV